MQPKNDVNILVDYITFTIGLECLVESVENSDYEDEREEGIRELLGMIFGFSSLQFRLRKGFNGYERAYFCLGGITVAIGGRDDVMIQMSGSGCRLYESVEHSLDWPDLIKTVQQFQRHNFSRLDIACDTFGELDMGKLQQFTLQQRYISRFNDYLVSIGNKERSIMFGSPASRVRLRIYDKSLERARVLQTSEGVPENWVRLEFQFRDAAADSFIAAWQSTGNISTAYFGIMANQLRYVKERSSNLVRSVTVIWWRKFLGNAEKIPMAYRGGLEYNLQSLTKYVFGQAGSSIRAWLELCDYDTELLVRTVKYRPLNDRQLLLLEKLRREREMKARVL